ncbi:MAG: hypothetical protein IPK58_25785 [Acidobacteria bacterium]|nr:hypothetical protein [Acidobacteriota bacterium]
MKPILFLLLTVFATAAFAQERWTGRYEFEELGGKTSGGTAIIVNHEIEITDSDDGLIALIRGTGFQTSRDLVGNARVEGEKLLIYFNSYNEDNVLEPYAEGDLLLTLERRKGELLTFWGKYLPVVQKNEKTGKVYFTKVKIVEE